jgi:hemerythrin-like domain-containing protein
MEFPPLKRHEALRPLSREHFNGLRHARQLALAAGQGASERRSAAEEFVQAWRNEIESHFDDEERLLGPLASADDLQRMLAEHKVLRELAQRCVATLACGEDPSTELVGTLGSLLQDHIRWEERQLFETVQRSASDEEMGHIAEQTSHIEALRPGSRTRQELTKDKSGAGCGCGGCQCSKGAANALAGQAGSLEQADRTTQRGEGR